MKRVTYYALLSEGYSDKKKVIVGTIPQLGVSNFAVHKKKTLERLTGALELYLESCKDVGKKIPPPKYIKGGEPITVYLK